jgi:putative ABC transport system substrate-binding protein
VYYWRRLRCDNLSSSALAGKGSAMRRRQFIALLGGAAVAWPSTARAQETPLIAWLDGGGQPRPDSLVAFRSGLNELGYVEGHNVAIAIHGVEQPEQLSKAITELMRDSAAAIFVNASWKAVNAAKAATSTLPIVFADGSGDPVKLGIVASLARPGGNITGVSMYTGTLVPKRLELLRKVVPQAATIAFLTNPNNLGSELDTMDVQAAARAMGQDIMVVHASTKEELDEAFETIAQRRAGALLTDTDVFFNRRRGELVALAARYRIPVCYSSRPYVLAGGLMSYSDDRAATLRRAGIYTGRVLRGDKPADLPVLLPTKFQFVVNLKTAKALGLDLQWRTVLAYADEVIE